mgnify:CR=1
MIFYEILLIYAIKSLDIDSAMLYNVSNIAFRYHMIALRYRSNKSKKGE